MTAKAFEMQVQDDHLARTAQTRKPILAPGRADLKRGLRGRDAYRRNPD